MLYSTSYEKKKIYFIIFILNFLFSACALSRHESLQFIPAIDENLPSRGKLAQITTTPDSELIQNQYVHIGSLIVDLNQTECFKRRLPKKNEKFQMCEKVQQSTDPTTRLLREASRRGADLVSLVHNNVRVNNQSIEKEGECLRYKTHCTYAYETSRSYCYTACSQYRMLMGKADILRSSGVLWRHDKILAEQVRLKSVFTTAINEGNISKIQALISEGADVNWKNYSGLPMITVAVISKQPEALKILLENKAQLNVIDKEHKRTALQYSILLGQLEMTKIFVQGGVDLNFIENNRNNQRAHYAGEGYGALHTAAGLDKKEMAEIFLKHGARVNLEAKNGDTPLHQAVAYRHLEMAELLISHKADVNSEGQYDKTPLFIAASNGDSKMVKILISKGAKINQKSMDGRTALHGAIMFGHLNTAEILLSEGADIEADGRDSNTPLHTAASVGNIKAFEFLKAKGADINAKASGRTLLHTAAAGYLVGSPEDHGKMVEMLINQGFSVHESSGFSMTPLHWAAWSGTKEAGEALVKHGAKTDASGIQARPLFQAAAGDNAEMIAFLIDKGVDPNEGWSFTNIKPIMWAADKCSPNAVKMLIKKGVDVFRVASIWATPYDAAKYHGCESVMFIIEEKLEEIHKELQEIKKIQRERRK